MPANYYSLSSASLELRISIRTLRRWRERRAIGPFGGDPYTGREVLTEGDLEQIRTYNEGRRRAQGLDPEDEVG
jgi:hypothetical protein